MARIPAGGAPHEIMSRFEWRWLSIGIVGLALILCASVGFVVTHPGRIPVTPQIASVKTILASEMFAHPGVTEIGPKRFRAVVIARQYAFTPSEIDVPAGSRVDFFLTSADVVHGFEIPGGNVNVEVFPGYVAHVFATFRTPGTYRTVCDQYCGIGHQNMLGTVSVLSDAAYARSRETVATAAVTGTTSIAGSQAAGAAVYTSNCVSCHQATGRGLAGAFPPLAGTLGDYTKTPAGRLVLTHVLLDGLQGPIDVNHSAYNGAMPAWGGQLTDRQIADVLEYVTSAWGNGASSPKPVPFADAAVAAARQPALSATAVAAERAKLSAP